MNQATITNLRHKYPSHLPLKVAAKLLGISEQCLSCLIAEGRKPFCDIGVNIGQAVQHIIKKERGRTNMDLKSTSNLVDINNIKLNPDDSIEKRFTKFSREVKNPYRFLCGETIVNIAFNNENITLEKVLIDLFSRIKNR